MERPPGAPGVFGVRTVVYLRRGDHPPELDEDASTALHHAHLAHLGDLVARGIIAANGPLLDQSDPTMRGMSVYTVPVDEARRLAESDPAVRAESGSGSRTSSDGRRPPRRLPRRSRRAVPRHPRPEPRRGLCGGLGRA